MFSKVLGSPRSDVFLTWFAKCPSRVRPYLTDIFSVISQYGRDFSTDQRTSYANDLDLNGMFLPLPTPFREDERQTINYEMLRHNLQKWETVPLKGYCIAGTNGESPFLKDEEKLSLIRSIKSQVDKSKLIIAGTSCESTEKTCELSQAAVDAGADAVLVMPPHYFKNRTTENMIIDYFIRLADFISKPVIIYNATFVTGIDISVKTIKVLARHPNIRGIKDSDVTKLGCIVHETKTDQFSVLAGSAGYLLPAMMMGCSGGINGLVAVVPEDVQLLFTLASQQKWEKAVEIQKRITLLDSLLLRELGPPGLKAAMDMLGYFGGLCRRPLLTSSEREFKVKIEDALKQYTEASNTSKNRK